jgi:predicted nucleic acid-binding protein
VIVTDTNVTVQLLVAGNLSSIARRLYALDDQWIVPPVWAHEFMNVLVAYGKSGGLSTERCVGTWRGALDMFSGRIVPVDTEAALSLAAKHRLSGYDAQFITLAREQGVGCITEDRRLRDAFPVLAYSIEEHIRRLIV